MSIIFDQSIVMMYEFETSGNKVLYFSLTVVMLSISDVDVFGRIFLYE